MCESGAVLRDEPVGKKRRSCSVAGPIERGSLKKKKRSEGRERVWKKEEGGSCPKRHDVEAAVLHCPLFVMLYCFPLSVVSVRVASVQSSLLRKEKHCCYHSLIYSKKKKNSENSLCTTQRLREDADNQPLSFTPPLSFIYDSTFPG
jgi:hypothetical protein